MAKPDPPLVPEYRGLRWTRARLPTEVEGWPLADKTFFVGAGESDMEVSRAEAKRYVSGKPWTWPSETIYFFCDIHADADAFLDSLVASGGVERTGPGDADFELTAAGKNALFIIGGDCLDKGPSNLRLLRVLRCLFDKGARVQLLAGNHDLRTMLGIRFTGKKETLYAHLFVRMGQKSMRLFKEVYDDYLAGTVDVARASEREARELLFPGDDWYRDFPVAARGLITPKKLNKEVRRIQEKEQELAARCAEFGLTLWMVYAAVKKTEELFLRPEGEFSWFFDRMKLACRDGSLLFIHAGVDDTTASTLRREGVAGLNREFRAMMADDLFTLYHGPVGNTFRTKYRDIDFPLTESGTKDVHGAGVYAVIHGHRNLPKGQRITLRQGLLNFECDASVDRNTRALFGLRGAGAAVTICRPDCRLVGISADSERAKVFDLAELDKTTPIFMRPPPAPAHDSNLNTTVG